MRILSTHPPCEDACRRYRRDGHWLPAFTVAEHRAALCAGGARVALVDDRSEWTYARLAFAVENLRATLAQSVSPGDAVLVIAPLRNEAVAAYHAVVQHGAVAVLLDRRCGAADVENACRSAGASVALAFDNHSRPLGVGRHCRVVSLDRVGPQWRVGAVPENAALDPDAPAVVVFTSGTTSTPKGVIHTINSLRCGTANMVSALDVGSDDAFFLASPLASITGVLQLESALRAHAKIILSEDFSRRSALGQVCAHGATLIGGAPVIAESLFEEAERQRLDRLPVRCIAVGGTAIGQRVVDSAVRFGVRPVGVYGSSEVPFSTSTALGEGLLLDDGAPLCGVEVAIRDPGGDDELLIRGPHQFHGYLDPADNAGSFDHDWVRTGDQGAIDGGRVRIKGRLKEIVIRKGMKISLAEIDVAAAVLGECAAFAVPDDATGERLALAICRAAATDRDMTYDTVVEPLSAAGLAKWKLPEEIVLWDEPLPRTASGKVIRERLADEGHHLRSFYAPRIEP